MPAENKHKVKGHKQKARIKKSKIKTHKRISAEEFRQKLKLKHFETRNKLKEKYPQVEEKLKEKGLDPAKIRQHSAKIIGTGILTGTLLLSPSSGENSLPVARELIEKLKVNKVDGREIELGEPQKLLTNTFESVLPKTPRPLERNEEKFIEQLFEQLTGIRIRASLEGEHLNTTYGYIGAEQHLRRYPGDTLLEHGTGDVINEGIAPGLGAWGYFAPTREKLTDDLIEKEKWYAVVQTLYLPDWNTRQPHLRNWYKYRKVLIVNTENGNAVVAGIADSGPAAWTGKHFGGSPEVMDYLGGTRYKKGPVIIFFVDDPENKIPLGPVEYGNNIKYQEQMS